MKTVLIACCAVVAATSPALASDPAGSAAIRHADLDLSKPADRRLLHRRIARATDKVCGSYASVEHSEEHSISRCRRDVAQQVRTQFAARPGRHLAAR